MTTVTINKAMAEPVRILKVGTLLRKVRAKNWLMAYKWQEETKCEMASDGYLSMYHPGEETPTKVDLRTCKIEVRERKFAINKNLMFVKKQKKIVVVVSDSENYEFKENDEKEKMAWIELMKSYNESEHTSNNCDSESKVLAQTATYSNLASTKIKIQNSNLEIQPIMDSLLADGPPRKKGSRYYFKKLCCCLCISDDDEPAEILIPDPKIKFGSAAKTAEDGAAQNQLENAERPITVAQLIPDGVETTTSVSEKENQKIRQLEYKVENLLALEKGHNAQILKLTSENAKLKTDCVYHAVCDLYVSTSPANQKEKSKIALTHENELPSDERAKLEAGNALLQIEIDDLKEKNHNCKLKKAIAVANLESAYLQHSTEKREISTRYKILENELARQKNLCVTLDAQYEKWKKGRDELRRELRVVNDLRDTLETNLRDTQVKIGKVMEENKILHEKLGHQLNSSPVNTESFLDDKDPLEVKKGRCRKHKEKDLLKRCQTRIADYPDVDITNFSTSWENGMALCALLHSYLPQEVPFESLTSSDVRNNFRVAFRAAQSVGIPTLLDIEGNNASRKPYWKCIVTCVTEIFSHFEM